MTETLPETRTTTLPPKNANQTETPWADPWAAVRRDVLQGAFRLAKCERIAAPVDLERAFAEYADDAAEYAESSFDASSELWLRS